MLVCNNISKIYKDGTTEVSVLSEINLNIDSGDTVAIVGSSGSGKSTLLHVLSGLENITSGEIFIDNMLISKLSENDLCKMRTSKIGFIYQFHHLIKELSVRENISLPLLIKNNDNSDIRMAADNIIDQVGLKHRADYQIDKLSGGERQRVAIARSVVHNPKIIFADEPTGNLDKNNAKNILSLLSDLVNFNNSSLIMATHDLEMAALLNKRMSIENGSINTI
ncbi:MAG: ABC transporter ATP-binding protein [Gammaproteobacteria bacterium]|jgi:lipoprotein-releasing system ATP-binding protein|nr:ABC transporter ATP-binding protein [Gammaproteobacteria bacterium]MBT7603347.1 ABC transporter ATP-binding protein [Gammaproteobacteria bacterium]